MFLFFSTLVDYAWVSVKNKGIIGSGNKIGVFQTTKNSL